MRIRYVSSDVCSSDLSSRAGCRSCRRCRATRWARWKRRGCGRSTPLCSGIEAAAQRHIKRDEAGEQFAAAFDQRLLGREEVSLGVQHLQIVRHSVPVAKLGQLCEVALRGERPCLRVDLLGQIAAGGKRISHLLKGGLYRPLIGRNGNVLARLGDIEIGRIAPEIEDREDKRRTKATRLAVIAEKIIEIGRGVAEAP